MSKSVVLRLTSRSSRAFNPPTLNAPPVTAPPARTSAIFAFGLRTERSLFWMIVIPITGLSPRRLPARASRQNRVARSNKSPVDAGCQHGVDKTGDEPTACEVVAGGVE